MVVPMKKVSLVVMDKHQEESLKKLRDVGVVHIERKNVSSDTLTKLLERKVKIETVLGMLRSQEAEAKAAAAKAGSKAAQALPAVHYNRRVSDFAGPDGAPFSAIGLDAEEREDLIQHITRIGEHRKSLQERTIALTKEQSRLEAWGSFSPKDIQFLKDSGIALYLYELTGKAFEALPKDIPYIVSGGDKKTVRLLTVGKEIPGETPFEPGKRSLDEVYAQLIETNEKLADANRQLTSLATRRPAIETQLKDLLKQIEFETARSGMDSLADGSAQTVSWLTGFVPDDELGQLKRAAAENGWALLATEPGPDDMVPTKLKNNRVAGLLKPLTDFLEVTPGYQEADISGWFLLFFVIFFGMIFGDAGYGAIILIAALIGICKTVKKGVPPVLKLMILLGGSNFVWGVITCTWFGVDADKLPYFLQDISLPLISNVAAAASAEGEAIVRQNLMIICFSLALVQLTIGHIIAISRTKSIKILADIGAIAMLAGMYGVVLILIASNEYRNLADYIPMMPCVYALGGGFVVNFIFANYEGSVGRSILEGLKNIISMILGIANVFSDIMSYIRLWAVGLAGGAISSTVVSMAGPMLGHFIFFIFGVILLVFGHGLNLVLNVLSVLVHGVRLNTLEFSGHVGLTWAGTPYRPFSNGAKAAVAANDGAKK